MERVELVVYGRRALVDKDMVKKVLRKEALVQEMIALKNIANTMSASEHLLQADAIMGKIIRLNRTMRSTFLSFL
jgi:hypothetical protein